ncbi:MAG: hypothetical protein ACXWFF_00160 [Methylomonas sp.]
MLQFLKKNLSNFFRNDNLKQECRFTSSHEVYLCLKGQIEKEIADGKNKMANQDYWHSVGYYVYQAANNANDIIEAIDINLPTNIYINKCKRALISKAEKFVSDSDDASYYRPTIYSILRQLE